MFILRKSIKRKGSSGRADSHQILISLLIYRRMEV